MQPFSLQLKQARSQAGLTQAALAEMLGVAQITLRKWEAGDREPPVDPPLTQGDVLRFLDEFNHSGARIARSPAPSRDSAR